MTGILDKIRKNPERETLTEAYEVRAFRDDSEEQAKTEFGVPEIQHPEPGDLQIAKNRVMGHGEQCVVPDDCEFGDNDVCNIEG